VLAAIVLSAAGTTRIFDAIRSCRHHEVLPESPDGAIVRHGLAACTWVYLAAAAVPVVGAAPMPGRSVTPAVQEARKDG